MDLPPAWFNGPTSGMVQVVGSLVPVRGDAPATNLHAMT